MIINNLINNQHKLTSDTDNMTLNYSTGNETEYEILSYVEKELSYSPVLPQNLNIFDMTDLLVDKIEDKIIKSHVDSFLNEFKDILTQYKNVIDIDNNLSKLNMNFFDDGSVLIEWNFNYFRIGFAFEKNLEESSYYIIAEDQEGSFVSKSGLLKKEDFNLIITVMLFYVLENS